MCELFLLGAVAVYATRALASRTAMLAGAALLVPSVALLVTAQALGSLWLLVAGTAVAGLAAAMGYRGGVQVVNEIAPGGQRAEVLSSFLIVCYTGNSLPVVGVGVLSSVFGPMAATAALAGVIAVLALVALATELRFGGSARPARSPRQT